MCENGLCNQIELFYREDIGLDFEDLDVWNWVVQLNSGNSLGAVLVKDLRHEDSIV